MLLGSDAQGSDWADTRLGNRIGGSKGKKKKKGKGVSVVVRWGIKNESKGGYAPPNAEIP